LLNGKTALGKLLFKDASINLHSVETLNDRKLMTRWTLRLTVKLLPWQPTGIYFYPIKRFIFLNWKLILARFTGVSIYDVENGKIIKQEDYWDSINLLNGNYSSVPVINGIKDFLGQIFVESSAEMAAPELPYELLRRANRYEIRRYPAITTAQTVYDQRPEGKMHNSFICYNSRSFFLK
jgi:hypothetical protein